MKNKFEVVIKPYQEHSFIVNCVEIESVKVVIIKKYCKTIKNLLNYHNFKEYVVGYCTDLLDTPYMYMKYTIYL